MLDASYIGDDLTGTGFSLVGFRVWPAPDSAEELWQLVVEERSRRHLVVLSSDSAGSIRDRLNRLLDTDPLPPVVVLPQSGADDNRGHVVAEAFRALGMEGLSR